ncbi:MAG: cytochrome c3 family protein [Pseudomonadota bacterium]
MKKCNSKIIVFIIILALGFIGIFGYLAEKKQDPIRVLMNSKGGPVVFDHKMHSSEDAAAVECSECHHNYDPDTKEKQESNCRKCHYDKKLESVCADDPIHTRCVGKNCYDCHADAAEEQGCKFCHK